MLQPLLEAGLRQTMNRLVRPILTPAVPIRVQRTLIRQAYRSSVPPRGCRFSHGNLASVPVVRTSYGKQQDGVAVNLEIYNGLWHVFQVHSGQLRRATKAVRTAGDHIKAHLTG
ncbi:MAG: hypothetical protein SV429_06430 [Pseudomonadota bacterium]|nr:hypothetical protein [Pseudomonadota bacterium]